MLCFGQGPRFFQPLVTIFLSWDFWFRSVDRPFNLHHIRNLDKYPFYRKFYTDMVMTEIKQVNWSWIKSTKSPSNKTLKTTILNLNTWRSSTLSWESFTISGVDKLYQSQSSPDSRFSKCYRTSVTDRTINVLGDFLQYELTFYFVNFRGSIRKSQKKIKVITLKHLIEEGN